MVAKSLHRSDSSGIYTEKRYREKKGYELAFTNILDIAQLRTSKTYFLKESFSLSELAVSEQLQKFTYMLKKKISQTTRHQISCLLRSKFFDGCQQAINP